MCDANRKVKSLSMLSPGAVPDTIAYQKGAIHRYIEQNELPKDIHFVADSAYPESNSVMTPCNRREIEQEISRWVFAKDNFNFYHSQIRINIECCFGMLIISGRFYNPHSRHHYSPTQWTPFWCVALCLHSSSIQECPQLEMKIFPGMRLL